MEFKEFAAKSVDEAITEASIDFGTTSDNIEYEVIEEGSAGLFGMFSKDAVIKARKKAGAEELIVEFLTTVLDKMDMSSEVKVLIDDEERTININLESEFGGDIIGKKGQNLDALQYLASLVANKEKEDYYRVRLDTKNYRERRQKTLENLAKNVASKVKKTRRRIVLDPMNPYERRIVHAYLQSDKGVTTKSEGDEPNRRVIVYYKK
ncbi:MAG: RNA-binding cell elongation regulator Jag/EloR [Lachnospiraceae bacterium]|jgi:spoIIIJ-associated protein